MRYLKYSILFFIFCVVFTASDGWLSLLFCAGVSLAAARITMLVFPRASENAKREHAGCRCFFGGIVKNLLFCLILLKAIYTGTFAALVRFIRSKGTVRAVLRPVTLKTSGYGGKLCIWQAVTLTPGTLSADADGQNMQVLCFEGDNAEKNVRQFDLLLHNPDCVPGILHRSGRTRRN